MQIGEKSEKTQRNVCESLKSKKNNNFFYDYCVNVTLQFKEHNKKYYYENLDQMNDSGNDDSFLWNYDLLEFDFDPTFVPHYIPHPFDTLS